MLNLLLFLATFPFKHRQLTVALLMIASVTLFKYYELAPTGEKKDINVGPFAFSVNMVQMKRRVAKPIQETLQTFPPAHGGASSASESDQIAPSLPQDVNVQIQSAPDNSGAGNSGAGNSGPGNSNHSSDPYQQFQNLVVGSMTPPPVASRHSFRLATVCFNQLDEQRLADPGVQNALTVIAQSCDLLAVQGIYDYNLSVVQKWVTDLNQRGGEYAFLGSPSDSSQKRPFVAFIYNRQVIAADRSQLVFLDAQNRLDCSPMAALFQTRGTTSDKAYTFVLINAQFDQRAVPEAAALTLDLFDAAQRAIAGEDDLILLGFMGDNINRRADFMHNPNLFWVWNHNSRDYFNRPMAENIVFYKNQPKEYKNEYNLIDLSGISGLTPDQLAEILLAPPLFAVFEIEERR